jgi:hypothetical protein
MRCNLAQPNTPLDATKCRNLDLAGLTAGMPLEMPPQRPDSACRAVKIQEWLAHTVDARKRLDPL